MTIEILFQEHNSLKLTLCVYVACVCIQITLEHFHCYYNQVQEASLSSRSICQGGRSGFDLEIIAGNGLGGFARMVSAWNILLLKFHIKIFQQLQKGDAFIVKQPPET